MSTDDYALTYFEIDIRVCSLTYGSAPCTAAIPTTGDKKCFNALRTCQDRANFAESFVTLRFAIDTDYLPKDIDCIPSITGVNYDGATISLGKDLGVRASVTVQFREHPHSDTGPGYDKYAVSRSYDAFRQGHYWAKFRSRQTSVRGLDCRLIRGRLGQAIGDMETHHFIAESSNGPTTNGSYSITAKDVLKLADGDRAMAPAVNTGSLNADISAAAVSLTLKPTGIGNLEYPASGHVAIAGKEIVSFTRVADVLTITRAQLNTTAIVHKIGDRVQRVLEYIGKDPPFILNDLFDTYAGIPTAYMNLTNWQSETDTYLQRVYTAYIAEPTPVKTLAAELIEQACLAMWWESQSQQVRLQVLRAISSSATVIDEDKVSPGTFEIQEQPDKRISECWTYFGQRNPLEPLDRLDNYRSVNIFASLNGSSDYGSRAIKVITSRWIPFGGGTTADRLNRIQVARFQDPPRKFAFELFRDGGNPALALGDGYQFGSFAIQDDEGNEVTTPAQIVWLAPDSSAYRAQAEEILFGDVGETIDEPNIHTITIDSDSYNINLRTLHDTIYPEITVVDSGLLVRVIINSGITVGSTSTATPAFDVGTWIVGVPIEIVNNGSVRGMGGVGGGNASANGAVGGPAFYTRYPVDIENNGDIKSGGGGGGAGQPRASGSTTRPGGGGGAGVNPGAGGVGQATGNVGSRDAGGTGSTLPSVGYGTHVGGNGGVPGSAGANGTNNGAPYLPPGTGGAAGAAIDGVSYCSFSVAGTRAGPEIN